MPAMTVLMTLTLPSSVLRGARRRVASVLPYNLDHVAIAVNDLDAAIDETKGELVRRAAHTLKSDSATLGASRLSALSKHLEELGRLDSLAPAPGVLAEIREALVPVRMALEELREDYADRAAGIDG